MLLFLWYLLGCFVCLAFWMGGVSIFKLMLEEDVILWIILLSHGMPYAYVRPKIKYFFEIVWCRVYYDIWEVQIACIDSQYQFYYEYIWAGWHELEARVFWFLLWRVLLFGI